MGYDRAGFDVMGVDIEQQKRYPFEFIQADAMTFPLEGFDAVHASPPCQGYSIMRNLPWLRGKTYPLLIDATRERLIASGLPWVIENVMGAHLPAGWLCGAMFGLPFYRHRAFETPFYWPQPGHPKHRVRIRSGSSLSGRARDIVFPRGSLAAWQRGSGTQKVGVGVGHAAGWRIAAAAMGVEWMDREGTSQTGPPVFTEYVGRYLLEAVRERGGSAR